MILWPEYKLAFLGVPRTASTSLHIGLMAAGAKGVGGQHQWPSKRYPQSLVVRQPGWRTAIVVREHVDWWRSYYDYRPQRNRVMTEGWVRKQQAAAEWRSMRRWPYACRWLYGPYLIYATDVLKFETLQADLDAVLGDVGAPPVKLLIENRSERRTRVPSDTAEFIRDWYSLERKMLGYAP